MKEAELKKHLYIGQVKDSELKYTLLSHFGGSQYRSKTTECFGDEKSGLYVEFDYGERGQIRTARTNLPEAKLEELGAIIRERLVADQEERVGQAICFSDEKITGFFQYRDSFQILPVGADYPSLNCIWADNPFILQFKYVASPHWGLVNQMRRAEKIELFLRILNVLSRSRLFTGTKSTRFFWALGGEGNSCEWVQEGYVPPSTFQPDLKKYSDVRDLEPIVKLAAAEYYERGFYRFSDGFLLPDDIEAVLDKIFSFDPQRWKRFWIACTWFSMIPELSTISSSAAYIGLVTSLEALMDKKSEKCSSCGQPMFAIARRFRELLQELIPNLKSFPQELSRIYQTRSDLAHGTSVLFTDLEYWDLFQTTTQAHVSTQLNTYQIAAIALLNWVRGV